MPPFENDYSSDVERYVVKRGNLRFIQLHEFLQDEELKLSFNL